MSTPTHETTPARDRAGVVRRPGRTFLLQLGIAVVLVMLLRGFVAQSFYVPSASMTPTIAVGDRVVVSKVGTDVLRPGDLVVFDGTDTFAAGDRSAYVSDGLLGRTLAAVASTFSIDLGEQDFLKRVAATGGQRLSCTPEAGLVRDGEQVSEDYLAPGTRACDTPFDVTVPEGHLFVLGDNREDSADSRAHLGAPGGGMVPEGDVVGEVVVRYWPLSRIGAP